ncbi:MAG: class I SAM-dependent methyltransferase [Pseudomonadota bacterium]|nr:class I SAM-dependent methyltransferase [Pseudomonadota bacterium]
MAKSDKDKYKNIYTLVREYVERKEIKKLSLNYPNKKLQGLEIGVGMGGNIPVIEDLFYSYYAHDLADQAITYCKENYPYNNIYYYVGEPDFSKQYDCIIMFSVLEHIKDDKMYLAKIYNSLADEGIFIFQVPAFSELFSIIDRYFGHYRRYDIDEIKQKLLSSGFEIKRFHSLGIKFTWGFEIWKFKKRYGSNPQFNQNEQNLKSSHTEYSWFTKLFLIIKKPIYYIALFPYIGFSKVFLNTGVEFLIVAQKAEKKC